ncbi:MBL fold metallo-hydrolase [Terrarubrum flagellatum]|uniref:MBL fold metallo-hydrolase n=1 Tax=Terrirubrum flagellatum TaxID=2895980 RepID=UPI003145066C
MNRRRFLKFLGYLGLAGTGGFGWGFWKSTHNPYYEGPVSDHFDGLRFFNPGGREPSGFGNLLRWQLSGGREPWPASYPSNVRDTPPAKVEGDDLRVSFIGHASTLIQTAGLNILLDPVWSERASPFTFAGPKRANGPGVLFDDLPKIDLVLITHNHYDHLDVATLTKLHERDQPRVVAALGNDKVIWERNPTIWAEAHDWGARVQIAKNVAVTLEPCHHWSARGVLDRRMALWTAFVIETPGGKIFAVGDSGYHDGIYYRAVKEKHGGFRFALLPIGAYEPRWMMASQHQNPEEAARAFLDCGADYALGHHWGTFHLTNEGIERPVEGLKIAREKLGISADKFRTLRPGEHWMAPKVATNSSDHPTSPRA